MEQIINIDSCVKIVRRIRKGASIKCVKVEMNLKVQVGFFLNEWTLFFRAVLGLSLLPAGCCEAPQEGPCVPCSCLFLLTAGWGGKELVWPCGACVGGFGKVRVLVGFPFVTANKWKGGNVRSHWYMCLVRLEILWILDYLQTQLWKINPWDLGIHSSLSPEIKGSVNVSVLRENFLYLRSPDSLLSCSEAEALLHL